jgi:undecaprenyl diphosphate synthase
MSPTSAAASVPRHVAIIMDGNRRWAKRRGLPGIEGHRRGIAALREVTRAASDMGVEIVTVYGFSTENWRRDAMEIRFLFELCAYFARTEVSELNRNNVRVRVIGDWEALPAHARAALAELQDRTGQNTGLTLNLAVNYSSRSELERAVRTIAREVSEGALDVESIDDDVISARLFTAGIPDPDLLIRPGGERRLSNFLLYQAAYTELVMTDVYWPDFARTDFEAAVREFGARQRRFGGA